jgi:hypothetical protein
MKSRCTVCFCKVGTADLLVPHTSVHQQTRNHSCAATKQQMGTSVKDFAGEVRFAEYFIWREQMPLSKKWRN